MFFLPCFYSFSRYIQCDVLLQIRLCRYYFAGKLDFPERTVQIQTCGQLYKTWKKRKVLGRLPESDLTFNVKFIDTRPERLNKSKVIPTILALHGAPGSWKDYTLLSSFLHERGCRVIAPSFPDFHVCKPGIFRHTPLEKAQYIKDFLAAISVSDATKHFFFLKMFVKAAENPIILKCMEAFGPYLLKNILRVPVKAENILDPLLSAVTVVNGNIAESKEKFLLILKKLPLLYIFSENDTLVGAKASYKLAELIGVRASDVFIYNSQDVLVQKGTATPTLKVLAFQEGSHYVFWKHPEVVNKEIADFLKLQNK